MMAVGLGMELFGARGRSPRDGRTHHAFPGGRAVPLRLFLGGTFVYAGIRRALLVHALGLAGVVTAAAAAASTLARGTYERPRRPHTSGRGAGAPGDPSDLGPASALSPGDFQAYTDPKSGEAAIVVRRPDGRLYALSASCTHAGCRVGYSHDTLACPV